MLNRSSLILVVLFAVRPAFGQSPAAPSPAEITKAEALVREIYGDEIAKAGKDAKALERLASRLLQEARETSDYPAGRLVLLERARELAILAGDVDTALQAIDETLSARGVKWDEPGVVRLKIEILAKAHAADTEARSAGVEAALALLDDALALDDFPSAERVLAVAEETARDRKSVALLSQVRRRSEEMLRAKHVFDHYRPYAERLARMSSDSEAATQLGLYYGLVKGNWTSALPLLAKGDHAEWKSLAAADLAGAKTADDKIALGQRWSKSRVLAEPAQRMHIDLRACHWLRAAADQASDPKVRSRAQTSLDWILANVPVAYRSGEIAAEWTRYEGHQGPAYAAAFTGDGRKVVSVGADGLLHFWNARTGKELRRSERQGGRMWCVASSTDGRRVITGGFDGVVRLWDVASASELRTFGRHNDYVRCVGFSGDGKIAFSAGDDRVIRLWEVESGKEIRTLPGHGHSVWSGALSADGSRMLSGSLDKTVRLWDTASGKELKKLVGHRDTVLAVSLSADGRRALTGSTDRTVKLWDLETGECQSTLAGHQGFVHSVAFSPDGRRALSASQDRTIRLWDLLSEVQVRALDDQLDQVWSVAFSRDGRFAISAGQDGTVRVWGGPRPSVAFK